VIVEEQQKVKCVTFLVCIEKL